MRKDFFSNDKKNSDISESLRKCLEKYEKINYVYGVMNKRNTEEMIIISDFPKDLVDNYLNNKQQDIDPVVINALNRISPFSWDEDLRINYQWTVKKVFDPVKPHNISNGYAFVLHDQNNYLAILSLYIDGSSTEDITAQIEKNKDELQGVLIYTHEALLHVYQDENSYANNVLSSREAEVLYWASAGKTYTEAADILKITVSTVKFHMKNIVNKMGVRNAKHAIRLGIELNLVSPPRKKL